MTTRPPTWLPALRQIVLLLTQAGVGGAGMLYLLTHDSDNLTAYIAAGVCLGLIPVQLFAGPITAWARTALPTQPEQQQSSSTSSTGPGGSPASGPKEGT